MCSKISVRTHSKKKKKVGRPRERWTDQHPRRQKKREKAYTPLPITSLKIISGIASTITTSISTYIYKAVILSGFPTKILYLFNFIL
jgi:hypothetical protein